MGQEVKERGFKALKTNIIFFDDNTHGYGYGFGTDASDQTIKPGLLRHVEKYIGTFKEAVGPDVEIALDLNFNVKPQAAKQICSVLEQFDMMWVEIDMYEVDGLKEVKDSTSCPITSGENLFTIRDYRPYFAARAMDIAMIDVPWQGFARGRDVGMLAESHEINVAPHNYYSHLATMQGINLMRHTAQRSDLRDRHRRRAMERRPHRRSAELSTTVGLLDVPTKPGWGVELDEDVARAHELGSWPRGPGYR